MGLLIFLGCSSVFSTVISFVNRADNVMRIKKPLTSDCLPTLNVSGEV